MCAILYNIYNYGGVSMIKKLWSNIFNFKINGYAERKTYIVVVSMLLTYIMFITFMFPTMSAYAASVGTESGQNTISEETAEVKDNYETFNEYQDEKNAVGESIEDLYKKTWNQAYNSDAEVVGEVEELRTATDKHFLMSDGSYTLASYSEDIHYLEDGEYKEIDNSLEKDENNVYKNKANSFSVELPEVYSADAKTVFSVGEYGITFKLLGYVNDISNKADILNKAKTQKIENKENYEFDLKNESKIKYDFGASNVELEQVLSGPKFKENIIVKAKMSSYVFSFDVKTDNVSLVLNEHGDILALNAAGEYVFMIPKGYMFDANDAYSSAVTYALTENVGGYTLTVTADDEWINAKERAFPVTIDPTVEISGNSNVQFGTRHGYYSADIYKIDAITDNDKNTKVDALFLKYSLPALPVDTIVVNAELLVKGNNESNGILIYLYACDNAWTTNSNLNNITFGFDSNISNEALLPDQQSVITDGEMNFNITRNIKNILEYGYADNGFALTVAMGETQGAKVKTTSDLTINYRSGTGIESYWDYATYGTSNDSIIP